MNAQAVIQKPIPLRVIFILNALMCILPFFFAYIVSAGKINPGIPAEYMVYTGVAYIFSFAALVTSILKRNLNLVRVVIGINILIALPTKAYIGIVVAIISGALAFNSQVKRYFA